jgi:hypothetical protein
MLICLVITALMILACLVFTIRTFINIRKINTDLRDYYADRERKRNGR